ncbi:unnamed protein product [Caenorhabditis brenneri]
MKLGFCSRPTPSYKTSWRPLEAFYILLYIRAFWAGSLIFGSFYFMSIFRFLAFPIVFVKSAFSIVHLYTAAEMVVAHDGTLQHTEHHQL